MTIVHDTGSSSLELSNVSVRYDGSSAIEQVSFTLATGEHLAIVGPNGAGKSSLLMAIAGVIHPFAGTINVYGHGPHHHICIGYLPQRAQIDLSFPIQVRDVVMMGRVSRIGILRRPKHEDWEIVDQALDSVGLTSAATRQIGSLSGGQQQRMLLARALAQEAEIMLMDEPMTGLDSTAQDDMLWILDELRRRTVTVLVSTHDLNFASDRFHRVALLNRRLLGIGESKDVFTAELLLEAYGSHARLVRTDDGSFLLSDTCCNGTHLQQ